MAKDRIDSNSSHASTFENLGTNYDGPLAELEGPRGVEMPAVADDPPHELPQSGISPQELPHNEKASQKGSVYEMF